MIKYTLGMVHIKAHWRSKGVFDNLVKFVYKLGKNWQTRAWVPAFKTAGSAPDAAMILGLFSQKNLKINIDRKLYWIVHFYLDSFCASSEWYSNNQNYEVKQGEQGRPQKAKWTKPIRMQFFLLKTATIFFMTILWLIRRVRQFERRD